ncbi:fatty acid desaturase [Pseudomonas aeruginosa]|nr:fatty acid desaturase [Pseudomonas aeruginosa]
MLPGLAPFACLHMSLQHELIHGHPARWPAFNALPGYLSLAAWYPCPLYRDGHLRHHLDDRLTYPGRARALLARLWLYLLGVAYPALGLSILHSFTNTAGRRAGAVAISSCPAMVVYGGATVGGRWMRGRIPSTGGRWSRR